MKKSIPILLSTVAAAIALSTSGIAATDTVVNPDNTKMNKQSPNREMTADQQGQSSADVKMTQQVRQKIQKQKGLSTYAHNVKVITKNGMVTLKGPVRSEKEKMMVEKLAGQIAGKENVTSEIEVAPKK